MPPPPDFIYHLKQELAEFEHGPYFMHVLEKARLPIEEMPADLAGEYPNNPAMLYLPKTPKIYLRDFTTSDDLAHEIRHADQYLHFPDSLTEPSDVKHMFIFFACAEADAMAHQLAVFIERLQSSPKLVTEETEIYTLYNTPEFSETMLMEPIRTLIYTGLQMQPEKIAQMDMKATNAQENLMDICFRWALESFVPHQYEDRHLDGVWSKIQKSDHLRHRDPAVKNTTQADVNFFLECVREFGAPFDVLEACYLIDENAMGPHPEHFLAHLFTPSAILELDRLNATIPAKPYSPELPPAQGEQPG